MTVKVHLPTVLRPLAEGDAIVPAVGSTLGEAFDDLASRFPRLGERLFDDDGELQPFINVFVGDEDVRYLDGLATGVDEGSEITILPAVAGG